MPDKPDMALASMGIYVFATEFLFEQLRRDAADPNSSRDFGKDLIPYLVKHGKALAHRFTESCVRSGFEAEAYWRDVGTVDAYWQANIDLTDVDPGARSLRHATGRSGPMARSRRPPSSCTTTMAAAARRSARWCPAAASSPARRCAIRCCSPASTCIRLPASRTRWCCPMWTSAAPRGCATSSSTAACRIPEGLVVGEDPAGRRRTLPAHRAGRLPDHAADDRPPEVTASIDVLAVVSEIFPLVKTGGLADVAGALPGALAAEGVAVRSLVPGYPAVLDALAGGVAGRHAGRSVRRPGAHPGRPCVRPRPVRHRRAASLRARRRPVSRRRTAAEWPDNAFRFAALSRVAMLLARGLVAGYRPDVVHAHDWQAGLAPAYLHYARRQSAGQP